MMGKRVFGGVGRAGALLAAGAALMLVAAPAAAQFSDSYKFLKGVKDRDGAVVMQMIGRTATLIDTKDQTSGEAALHIVVKRRDATWLAFLLSRGAKPDIRDREGATPLFLAARLGFPEGVQTLLESRASVNLGNGSGETPLIAAVQNRDLATVRLLLAAGADPLQTDRIAGQSARDYAAQDARAASVLKLLDEVKPKKPAGKIAGPL